MNWWKVATIVFFLIALAETSLIGAFIWIAYDLSGKEKVCSTTVCGEGYQNGTYDSYLFDGSYCFCYLKGEVKNTRYLG